MPLVFEIQDPLYTIMSVEWLLSFKHETDMRGHKVFRNSSVLPQLFGVRGAWVDHYV